MAVPTLANTPALINNADSVTNWTGEGGVDPDIKLEGNNAVFGTMTSDGDIISFDGANFLPPANTHVRAWVQFTALGDLDFMEMFLGGNNTAYWEIFKGAGYAGSDPDTPLYRGGWFYCIIDWSSTPNSGTKPTLNITQVGWRFQRTGNPRNVTNMWIDALYYGNGYTATGGTSGDPITFSTIADVDIVDAYGIVQNIRDTNFLFGEVTIGNGATATYMEVANEAAIFADAPVSSTLYKIIATGSGCTFDAVNSLFKANGTQTFDFDMSGVNTLVCTGNVFIRAGSLSFGTGQTLTSNTFIECGSLTTNGASVVRGSFDMCAPVVVSDLSQLDLCTFTGDNTQAAVELTSLGSGTMDWTCKADTGYAAGSIGTFTTANDAGADAAIFVNVASGTLTINVITPDGSTPSIRTAGATITIAAEPTLFSVTGLKDGTEVRIINSGTNTEIAGVETVSGGTGTGGNGVTITGTTDNNTVTYSYQYSADIPILVAIVNTNYEIIYRTFTLSNFDQSIPIAQQLDRNYNEGATPFTQ